MSSKNERFVYAEETATSGEGDNEANLPTEQAEGEAEMEAGKHVEGASPEGRGG